MAVAPTDPRARLAALTRGGGGWVPEPEPPTAALPVPDPAFGPSTTDDAPRRRGMPPRVIIAALFAAVVVCGGLLARGVLSDAGAAVETIPAGSRTLTAGRQGAAPTGAPHSAAVSVMSPGGRVVVHVVGRVRRQGVVTLSVGARVGEAITAAGGAASGAAPQRLNLARRVVDGEQIVVPGPRDAVAVSGAAAAGGTGGEPAALDLNTATQAQLDELPGVGPVTAAAIIAWRTQHQRFSRVEELAEVDGIGPKTLERLRSRVRV